MSIVPKLELKDGNKIPKIGLGTFRAKGNEVQKSVKIALDNGYDHIDTAEMYKNEKEIGEVIKDVDRSELFITSKVWATNLAHDDVLEACQKSLDRLGTSYLDLYLIHWPNEKIPMEETLDAMEELHSEEKVKSIGVSNFTKEQVEKAIDISDIPIVANQVEFHPWLYQKDLLNYCHEEDVALVAYAPIARGKVFEEDVIQELSEKYGKTPAQIVLRWEIEKGVVPIPKSSSEDHLKENIQVFDWELESRDIEKIDSIPTENRLVNTSYSDF